MQGFIRALSLNTDAVELDVVISKDLQVVVSHEPFMHHKKCLKPDMKAITKAEEKAFTLFKMDYEEIQRFDCGLKSHPNFPLLHTSKAYKPLLKEVIAALEKACTETGRKPIVYNIEIKSEAAFVGISQPGYTLFVELVLGAIERFEIKGRVIIQSFDKEILRALKKMNSTIPLSLLIEDELDPFIHIHNLGFKPEILASDFLYLSEENTHKLQAEQIKVFAFTVNKTEDINRLLSYGVDAIITDYPDIAAGCLIH